MKINLTDIRNMVLESCNMLLLEISNNAIETMIKKRYPKLHKFMDLSTEDLQYQPMVNFLKNGCEYLMCVHMILDTFYAAM